MKKTLLALVAILSFTFMASAADNISGKWVRDPNAAPAGGPGGGGAPGGGAPGGGGGGRGGGAGATWEFKVAGTKLTGSRTQAGRGGGDPVVTTVDEGKVNADGTFTFSIMQAGRGGGDPTKVVYTGKATDKGLEITADTGRGPQTTPLVKAPM